MRAPSCLKGFCFPAHFDPPLRITGYEDARREHSVQRMEWHMTNTQTKINLRYLEALNDHVLIYDGAMGTSIQRHNLTAEDFGGEKLNGCNDYLVITRPDLIEGIHASFFSVGSEVIGT